MPTDQPQHQGILVSDFDGTITRFDFYDLACQAFPHIAGTYWQQYEQGTLTHFEALRLIFEGIKAPEAQLLHIIDNMQIDPAFHKTALRLQKNGWSLTIASAGCDWYIRRLIKESEGIVTLHANPGRFDPEKGLLMRLPEPSPFLSPDLGVNKVAIVKEALKRSSRVAFAGDGRPDLAPALLVAPERRFARNWLAKKLQEIGEKFHPFDRWSEIADILAKEGAL